MQTQYIPTNSSPDDILRMFEDLDPLQQYADRVGTTTQSEMEELQGKFKASEASVERLKEELEEARKLKRQAEDKSRQAHVAEEDNKRMKAGILRLKADLAEVKSKVRSSW